MKENNNTKIVRSLKSKGKISLKISHSIMEIKIESVLQIQHCFNKA